MGIFKNIGKLGIVVSFLAAVGYEVTGYTSLKVFSLITGMLSLSILTSYLLQLKGLNTTRDVLVFLRLLK